MCAKSAGYYLETVQQEAALYPSLRCSEMGHCLFVSVLLKKTSSYVQEHWIVFIDSQHLNLTSCSQIIVDNNVGLIYWDKQNMWWQCLFFYIQVYTFHIALYIHIFCISLAILPFFPQLRLYSLPSVSLYLARHPYSQVLVTTILFPSRPILL